MSEATSGSAGGGSGGASGNLEEASTQVQLEEALEQGVAGIGASLLGFVETFGGMLELAWLAMFAAFRPPYRLSLLFDQLDFVGVGSIAVVGITGLFSGMVFGVESYNAFVLFNAQSLVGATVAIALSRELAPVFAGLMVTARVGSSMATELGSRCSSMPLASAGPTWCRW
jgi:phospholipid/cholesterol/gamma-HCH transport system permease protein